MKQRKVGFSQAQIDSLHEKAVTLSNNARLLKSCNTAIADEKARQKAVADPAAFLRSETIAVPEGLKVLFFERPPRHLPTPDWVPFTVEFFNCRKSWKIECDRNGENCEVKEYEVCFGFRIIPIPVPWWGPIA